MRFPSATMTTITEKLYRYRLLWLIVAVLLPLDQLSKYWIVAHSGFSHGLYPPHGGMEVIPGFFNLVYATNYGAAWGLFSDYGHVLIALGFLSLIAIFLLRRDLELNTIQGQVSFGLIISGIIGNTIDRLVHGRVIDFLDVDLQFYRWPTFNFADCGIVVGAMLYVWMNFRPGKRSRPN